MASVFRNSRWRQPPCLSLATRCFIDVIVMLLFEVATFLPNLVKIDPKMRERHQFFEMQDGGSRHAGFRLPGISRYHTYVVIRSRNIPTKFGEN